MSTLYRLDEAYKCFIWFGLLNRPTSELSDVAESPSIVTKSSRTAITPSARMNISFGRRPPVLLYLSLPHDQSPSLQRHSSVSSLRTCSVIRRPISFLTVLRSSSSQSLSDLVLSPFEFKSRFFLHSAYHRLVKHLSLSALLYRTSLFLSVTLLAIRVSHFTHVSLRPSVVSFRRSVCVCPSALLLPQLVTGLCYIYIY